MNILSIGNSFSQDAQRYIHQIAKADGVVLNTFNLYIGSSPLSLHYRNMLSERRDYILEMNGQSTNFKVSLKEGLVNRNWDIITLQQVSEESPHYDTYQPYLDKLAEYIRVCVPKAKLAIHQTWAYEQDCCVLTEKMGYRDHGQMFTEVQLAYQKAAQAIGADFTIPSGEVIGALVDAGVGKTHRDSHHVSLGLGRYALGLVWYGMLTGRDVTKNAFADFDEEITPAQLDAARKCAARSIAKYQLKNQNK